MHAMPECSAIFVGLIAFAALGAGQQQSSCPVGGSIKYCGYTGSSSGSISGNFSSPCSCNPNFCCSPYGYCGPEPTLPGTGDRSSYCGSGCQAAYGNCNPGSSYFEYIGTGTTCGQSSCPVQDQVNQQAVINQIPLPKSGAPFYFIVFLLSDQYLNPGSGTSTGNFGPVGLFAAGTSQAPYWDPSKIGSLAARGKVMGSIAGDTSVTRWAGVNDVSSYISQATASLRSYRSRFTLAGFDVNYEESINGVQQQQWLDSWCQIIFNLKQDGALITLAPYKSTIDAYKKLQDCLYQKNATIDFIIYQLYSETSSNPTDLTNALKGVQQTFAPTKIIAGVANRQLTSNANFVTQVIQPMLQQGVISGASVFDADTSSAASPKFGLEQALWAS